MRIDFQSMQDVVRQTGPLFPVGDFRRVPFKPASRKKRITTLFPGPFKFEVPIGYQDATGFHLGEMPRP